MDTPPDSTDGGRDTDVVTGSEGREGGTEGELSGSEWMEPSALAANDGRRATVLGLFVLGCGETALAIGDFKTSGLVRGDSTAVGEETSSSLLPLFFGFD